MGVFKRHIVLIMMTLAVAFGAVQPIDAQRRVTPVSPVIPGENTPANQAALNILTDTLANDSIKIPPMQCPLFHSVSIGVNVWDGVMRAFGQKYGIGEVWATLSFHNRYIAYLGFGLGVCSFTPETGYYDYKSPMAPYFKIGFDYNFLFNSNPNYCLMAGARYCFTPFKFSVDNIKQNNSYWGQTSEFSIPQQSVNAGFVDLTLGIKVKIVGPLSMGWNFIYHLLLHEGGSQTYGKPIYIPGFGKRENSISGAFSIIYDLTLNKPKEPAVTTSE